MTSVSKAVRSADFDRLIALVTGICGCFHPCRKKRPARVDRTASRPYISVCPQQSKEAPNQARVVLVVDSVLGDLLVSASASEAARGLRVAFTTPDL